MNEEKNESLQGSKNDRKTAAPFFAVLAMLTVISFILPLRPSESLVEKRRLAQFPAFSADALWSGDYFDDISLWFSDTFPGRDLYLCRLHARVSPWPQAKPRGQRRPLP